MSGDQKQQRRYIAPPLAFYPALNACLSEGLNMASAVCTDGESAHTVLPSALAEGLLCGASAVCTDGKPAHTVLSFALAEGLIYAASAVCADERLAYAASVVRTDVKLLLPP